MQTSLAEKALAAVNSVHSSSKTSIDSDLFQIITNSIQTSHFVAEVVATQCAKVLIEVSWHKSHAATNFANYLHADITQVIFKTSFNNLSGNIPLMEDFCSQFHSEISIMTFLREKRRVHSAAIAIMELTNSIDIEHSMHCMSVLAQELTQIAYLWSYANQQVTFGYPCNNLSPINDRDISTLESQDVTAESAQSNDTKQNMLILAMGKFGGYELNFSSDIDLIFFYPSEGETTGGRRKISNSRFFQKVGISLIKLLNEGTQDGFVFRVDMRLRPYGDSGSLVMSVAQAEDYYHEQGRGWERFAMVRARIITGRNNEKSHLEEIITPFAFRRYIDYGVIDSLRNMKEMIQREVRRRGLKGNIKLGAGGIREIEFMVQSLQLIQGGRDKRLQEKSILKVLPLLTEVKLLPKETSEELAKNYRFLRRLEHCIQELDEKQTQQLPEDSVTRQLVAKLMGFADWHSFSVALENLLQSNNEHFNALFGDEQNQSEQQDDFYLSLWEGHISSQKLIQKISSIDENDAEEIIQILNKFKHSNLLNNLSARGAKRLKVFFPALLAICLNIENPVKTLNSLLVILRAILKRTAYLDLLSENLPILQHLVDLVSRSDWIVQRLSDCPILFDELLYPNSLYEPLQTSDLQSELQQSLLRIDENDEEQILDAIRRFKQINELRVAAALLSERLSISQVSRYLTQLAQVIIQASLNQCWRDLSARYGEPEGLAGETLSEATNDGKLSTGFSVVAYGKLGGMELGFNSDLDLVFLFDQPLDSQTRGITDSTGNKLNSKSINISRFYTRLAQKLIHFLSTRTSLGVLYEVDMRLRPSGNSGLLVSHIEAFEEYQAESAWTWEHQALVRARAIAGDRVLCKKFELIRNQIIENTRETEKLKTDVVEMRDKMRKELDKTRGEKVDLKQCVGGLVDIEFLSQFIVLHSPPSNKQGDSNAEQNIAPSNTAEALKFAQSQNLLSSVDSKMLVKTYREYRNCLNEMAIVSGNKLIDNNQFVAQRETVKAIWERTFS